jgi:adenosine deaminase
MKAELHVHLEGLSCDCVKTYKNKSDFIHHLIMNTVSRRNDYYTILKTYLTKNKGILSYCEITVGINIHLNYIESLFTELNRAVIECPFITVRFIGLISQSPDMSEQYECIKKIKRHIVALGIGGLNEYPFDSCRDVISDAKKRGLRVTAHAGESTDPTIIKSAIECGVERIDHGVSAVYDDTVLELLKTSNIGLTVCPLSNKALGIPCNLRKLVDSGVRVCLNTDDPGLFNTTIDDVYEYSIKTFNLTEEEVNQLELNSHLLSFQLN